MTFTGYRSKSSIGISSFKAKKIVFRITTTKVRLYFDLTKYFIVFFRHYLVVWAHNIVF